MPKLCEPYNAPGSVVVVGSYPRRGDRNVRDLNGVASYMDNLAPHLKTDLTSANRRLIILSEKLKGEAPADEEDGVLVLRRWCRGSLLCFWQILYALLTLLPRAQHVLIQFEFNMFGGVAVTGMLPAFLLLLRVFGKTTSLMVHQVVEDLAQIRVHVGLGSSPVRLEVFRRLLRLFYWLLLSCAGNIAVHDQVLQERLVRIRRRQVVVIPHGCGEFKASHGFAEARQRLGFRHDGLKKERGQLARRSLPRTAETQGGQAARAPFQALSVAGFQPEEFVLLCFGFLTHYKGSDWIVREIAAHAREHPATPLRLVLAGGESPNHKGKPHYAEFISEVLQAAAQLPAIIRLTGYVPDERVPEYFSAADVAVFPYRCQIAASGPLAIALSFGCPILISRALSGFASGEDFAHALKENSLSLDDITFDLQPGDLVSKAIALRNNQPRLMAMRAMARSVACARNWSTIARDYLKLIDSQDATLPRMSHEWKVRYSNR